jgi:hypothetical protein
MSTKRPPTPLQRYQTLIAKFKEGKGTRIDSIELDTLARRLGLHPAQVKRTPESYRTNGKAGNLESVPPAV